jgi:hypothetical protein
MNWKNVDLTDAYERDQNILDPYSFDVLLMECEHNVKDINAETVKAQFEHELQMKIDSAREVFRNNADNILKEALTYRNME